MIRPLYILPAWVMLLPLLLALAPAMAQTVVYQGKTMTLNVDGLPGHTYEWEIYNDASIDFATTKGNCPVTSAKFIGGSSGTSVKVQWIEQGIYFYKVTARDALGCAMNLKIGMVKVIPIDVEAVISGLKETGACQQVKLDASKSIGDIVRYEWSLHDMGGALTRSTGITTEFLISPSYSGPLPANFRVNLMVTGRSGNTHSNTITIKVYPLPVAEVYSAGKLEKDGSMIVDGSISGGTAIKYKWFSTEGKIVGPDNEPTAKLNGAGIYSLEITDNNGCKSVKSFKFPLELHQIIANPDYARISWAQDTTIAVLANDVSTLPLITGKVQVIEQPAMGRTTVNTDGSITYSPSERKPGRDKFIYEVCDVVGLCAQATVTIDIYDSGITVPEGFSPNGDGTNQKLVFRGLEHYLKSQLYVFTRTGQPVYRSEDYLNDWEGTTFKSTATNLQLVPTGTYYYILKLGGTNRTLKGFVYIGY